MSKIFVSALLLLLFIPHGWLQETRLYFVTIPPMICHQDVTIADDSV